MESVFFNGHSTAQMDAFNELKYGSEFQIIYNCNMLINIININKDYRTIKEGEKFTANITMPSEKQMPVSRLDNAIARTANSVQMRNMSLSSYTCIHKSCLTLNKCQTDMFTRLLLP